MEGLVHPIVGQLLLLAGLGIVLLVVLFVFNRIFKLTKGLLKLGCLGILVLLLIAFIALQTMGR